MVVCTESSWMRPGGSGPREVVAEDSKGTRDKEQDGNFVQGLAWLSYVLDEAGRPSDRRSTNTGSGDLAGAKQPDLPFMRYFNPDIVRDLLFACRSGQSGLFHRRNGPPEHAVYFLDYRRRSFTWRFLSSCGRVYQSLYLRHCTYNSRHDSFQSQLLCAIIIQQQDNLPGRAASSRHRTDEYGHHATIASVYNDRLKAT